MKAIIKISHCITCFLLVLILSGLHTVNCFAQTQSGINYQAVARDSAGAQMPDSAISIRVSIISDSVAGTLQWQETHAVTTNQFGLFDIVVGQGTSTGMGAKASFTDITWWTAAHFLKIEMDPAGGSAYIIMGTDPIYTVPYAIFANKADTAFYAISSEPDADADSANELQLLSISNDTIYLSNGGFVALPSPVAETDPVFGSSVAGGITGTDTTNWNNKLDSYTETDPVYGSSVASGITGVDTTNWNNKLDTEVDGSVTNELQSLSISNDTIYLSNDGFVKLPADQTTDADADSTNELQVLSFSNDTLFLSNGNFVVMPYDSSIWTKTGDTIYYNNGNVGIGTTTPGAKLSVQTTGTTDLLNLIETAGDTVVTVLENGNVGIGTTNPLQKLHVKANSGDNEIRIEGSSVGVSSTASVSFYDSTPTRIGYIGDASSGTDDIYIVADANNALQFYTGGQNRLQITNTGNVGIGTTSPNNSLHINRASSTVNNLQITTSGTGSTGTDGLRIGFVGSTQAYIWNYENSGLVFGTNNIEQMRILNTGNVGIGTTSPSNVLHVEGTVQDDYLTFFRNSGANGYGLLIQATPGDTRPILSVKDFGGNSRLRVQGNGNVGIGTTSPSAKLHTYISSGAGSVLLEHVGAGDISYDLKSINTDYSLLLNGLNLQIKHEGTPRMFISGVTGNVGIGTTSPIGKLAVTNNTDTEIARFTSDEGNKVVIDKDGNVGIGTTDPGGIALRILKSSSTAGLWIETSATGNATSQIEMSTGDQEWQIWNDGTALWGGDNSFHIIDKTANAARFSIDISGNVGIGTTGPNSKLQVAGGDIYTSTAGNGFILKSPDGTICKRVSIDNTGTLILTAVACP